jgi:repressor LexA
MIGAGILDGDLALVRPQPTAASGEIVVALIDGEATIKRFFREPGRIRLQPENPALEPIIVRPGEGEVILVGKVVGLFRGME